MAKAGPPTFRLRPVFPEGASHSKSRDKAVQRKQQTQNFSMGTILLSSGTEIFIKGTSWAGVVESSQ